MTHNDIPDSYFDFDFAGMLKAMAESERTATNNFLNFKQEGTYKMRLLPPLPGEKLFYQRKLIHWIDGKPVLCLNQESEGHEPERCPLCLVAHEAYEGGDKEKGRKWSRKQRFIFRVVDRANESNPVFIDVPKSVFDKIYETMEDPSWGNVLHPLEGRDFTLVKTGEGLFTKYDKSKFSPQQTPIFSDVDKIKEFYYDKVSKLKWADVMKYSSREEIQQLIEESA